MHAEKDEAHLIIGGLDFTTKCYANNGLPIYNYVNGIYKFNAYNMEIHQDGGEIYNLTLALLFLPKWHRQPGHMNFRSIFWFTCLGLITYILTTIREEDILICSEFCSGKQSCTSPKIDGSGAGIADENLQSVMSISIDQIESPQVGLITFLKGKQTSTKYHVATICFDHFSKLAYVRFSESTTTNDTV